MPDANLKYRDDDDRIRFNADETLVNAVSPRVDVSTITGGHRVLVTDIDGSETFDVMDGAKGDKGDKGDTGDSGVYVGTTTPTDPDVNVWIDPSGGGFYALSDVEVNGTSVVTAGIAEISVPTAVSDLQNDSGYLTLGTLPIWNGGVV